MKKKLLIGVLALIMCVTLVGCNKTESNNNNTNNNSNQKENSTKSEKKITSEAKTSASKYMIDLDKLPVEYDVIDGYYQDANENLEIDVYLNKTYSKEDKIALHNSLVDFFKTIADDGKVYGLYTDEEYDKADTEASGIWIRATINSKKCKIYFGGHAPLDYAGVSYSESYRITVTPEK
jgi:uncharacterized protein YdeI (BOF family)